MDCPVCIPLIDLSARSEDAAAERARIRQLTLAHAEKWLADGSEFAAQALRELADELGER